MLQVEGRTGVGIHPCPRCELLRILEVRSLDVIRGPHLREVHHGGADGHRDALRLRVQLRQHVTRIVVQPLGLLAVALGRERDRAADLDDHLGHGFLDAFEQVVVVVEVRGQVPGRRIAHVEVQDGCAGVVAVHRRLDLLVPGDSDVGSVARQPRRPIRRRRDDQRLHVLGIQRVVGVVHGCCPFRAGFGIVGNPRPRYRR